jgi:hypothetical protein
MSTGFVYAHAQYQWKDQNPKTNVDASESQKVCCTAFRIERKCRNRTGQRSRRLCPCWFRDHYHVVFWEDGDDHMLPGAQCGYVCERIK